MFQKLEALVKRYEEIAAQLYEPTIAAQPDRFRELMKESNSLRPLVDTYTAYTACQARCREALELAAEAGEDKELEQLAQLELAESKKAMEQLEKELHILLLPKEPMDDRNVIVEIRAGAGGEESALFASSLYRMYTMYADKIGLRTEPISESSTELGGCKEVSFLIAGEGAYSRLKFESGVHRVQRVPETETGGRIHTSTVTVAVLPEADEVELEISPSELQIDTFRSSGAGGQHINKTESAIRITHLPTGTVVECQDERSQYKNKDKAMRVLRARLLEQKQAEQQSTIAAARRSQVGTGDRSERIRTYNFPQGRVTDHRIGLTLYKLEAVMNGDLDELVKALITADQAEKLQHQHEGEGG